MVDPAAAEHGIRQLHARYADAVWRKDARDFAACFTPDGEWRIVGMVFAGRAEIAAAITRILADARCVLIQAHTPLVHVGDDEVIARTLITETCHWTSRPPNINLGRYYERFELDGDRWLFSWRLFQLIYAGPADLSGKWFEDVPDFGPPPAMPPRNLVPPCSGARAEIGGPD